MPAWGCGDVYFFLASVLQAASPISFACAGLVSVAYVSSGWLIDIRAVAVGLPNRRGPSIGPRVAPGPATACVLKNAFGRRRGVGRLAFVSGP